MKHSELQSWLQTAIEKDAAADNKLTNLKTWVSPDRPEPDLMVEYIDSNGIKHLKRIIIV